MASRILSFGHMRTYLHMVARFDRMIRSGAVSDLSWLLTCAGIDFAVLCTAVRALSLERIVRPYIMELSPWFSMLFFFGKWFYLLFFLRYFFVINRTFFSLYLHVPRFYDCTAPYWNFFALPCVTSPDAGCLFIRSVAALPFRRHRHTSSF